VWFYTLGALLVLGAGLADATPAGLAQAMAALAGGWIVLLTLLVGETDEAFADIYSAAVSAQNLRERLRQRRTILVVAAVGAGLAVWLNSRGADATSSFELFLFLLGSVFVPLFGVFVADYFLLRRMKAGSVAARSLRPAAFIAWVVGFLVYQWSVPTGPAGWQSAMETLFHDWLGLPFPLAGSAAGASLPSFATALVLYVVLRRLWARRTRRGVRPGAALTP
jgi:purine-cytosine permease-like protein